MGLRHLILLLMNVFYNIKYCGVPVAFPYPYLWAKLRTSVYSIASAPGAFQIMACCPPENVVFTGMIAQQPLVRKGKYKNRTPFWSDYLGIF
jgi:hypothetical protein